MYIPGLGPVSCVTLAYISLFNLILYCKGKGQLIQEARCCGFVAAHQPVAGTEDGDIQCDGKRVKWSGMEWLVLQIITRIQLNYINKIVKVCFYSPLLL